MLSAEDFGERALDRRLERTGWGLFLVMIGGLVLVPGVQQGVWLVGTGVMLGMDVPVFAVLLIVIGGSIVWRTGQGQSRAV